MGTHRPEIPREGDVAVELHDCGGQIEAACRSARIEVLLAAPFIKGDAFERLLEFIDPAASLTVVTRWRLEDIASRVLDPEIWPMLTARGNARLFTRPDLHAKYCRTDNVCVVGSANLTRAALGWSDTPNFEIGITLAVTLETQYFEARLMQSTLAMDASRYAQSCDAAAALGELGSPKLNAPSIAAVQDLWVPQTRDPSDLWRFYSGAAQSLMVLTRATAEHDLQQLGLLARGLSQTAFAKVLANQISESGIVRTVDALLDRPRRFGEIRDAIALFARNRDLRLNPDHTWQTLMRWLLYFFPDRYRLCTPRHSEIFQRSPAPRG